MSIFTLPNGQRVVPGSAFEYAGNMYPANWLPHATQDERAALGLVETPDPVQADARFYYNNSDGSAPTPKSLTQITPSVIADIKARAGGLILERFPQYKQANMTARGVQLAYKLASDTPLDAGELLEVAALQGAWAWVKAVRDQSNALEAEVNAATFGEIIAWTPHDWPAP